MSATSLSSVPPKTPNETPHQQLAYAKELGHLSLPLTEAIHRKVVSLPLSPVLNEEQVAHVIQVVNQA